MSAFRSRRAAANAIGAAVVAAALSAGCAAGKQAQTAYEKPSVDAAQGAVGNILLESVALHAPDGSSYAKGATVPLTVYIANNGTTADTLTGITSTNFPGGYTVSSTAGASSAAPSGGAASTSSGSASPKTVQIGAGEAVGFGLQNLGTGSGSSAQSIQLSKLTPPSGAAALYPGEAVQITFTFAKAGQTTLNVPVQVTTKPNEQYLPSGSASAGA